MRRAVGVITGNEEKVECQGTLVSIINESLWMHDVWALKSYQLCNSKAYHLLSLVIHLIVDQYVPYQYVAW